MSNVREIAQYWAETNCFDETTREEAKLLLETATEEELMELFRYENLQLLPSEYNQFVKRDNEWDQEDFEKWLSL